MLGQKSSQVKQPWNCFPSRSTVAGEQWETQKRVWRGVELEDRRQWKPVFNILSSVSSALAPIPAVIASPLMVLHGLDSDLKPAVAERLLLVQIVRPLAVSRLGARSTRAPTMAWPADCRGKL
jgi:hypothetical protein